MSDPARTVLPMSREIMKLLRLASDAAAQMLSEAQAAEYRIRALLDVLDTAVSTAVRALPPDTSVREVRRYRDPDGRDMVELELELDDHLVAFLDTLPDRDAFIEEALRRYLNGSALGRHAYHRRLRAAAAELGLSLGWGADLDMWMEHYPDPPRRLTVEVVAEHTEWLSRRRPPRSDRRRMAPPNE